MLDANGAGCNIDINRYHCRNVHPPNYHYNHRMYTPREVAVLGRKEGRLQSVEVTQANCKRYHQGNINYCLWG